ncbi:glycosyltransferase family 2 protein [Deinococcus marmoris]|uniref:Glycosyl transferase, group 2 family protein n=1 Tax=Deinococcus marmoris TaxID=249408 RepID=A0A1U7NV43_9DEIO|nr:glycosyltransferase [Deinococcus marmoris]OLV16785.1 Glycosyl transferase, group 2 family protein [Deinococcus marmoris]
MIGSVLGGIELLILLYFTVLNSFYAVAVYVATRELGRHIRRRQSVGLTELLNREFYKPVSILVPAYGEEETIEASVNSFLALHYPEFEVIVVNDGSKDGTLQALIDAYDLIPTERHPSRVLHTRPIRGVYRSRRIPKLTVVDKENGGKADALNVGLTYATFPLFCAVDADSLLDAEALLRLARRFIENDRLVAAGGSVRIMNGGVMRDGRVTELRLPATWIERVQVVEYARAFLAGRTTFSALGLLLVISGAFGLFKRSDVMDVGGFLEGTVGEDMELVLRLHRHMREQKRPYDIEFDVDPVCWTQCPDNVRILGAQRDRWQRGLWEALWAHRKMWFNPRYGRIGLVALPYYLLFEALAPVIEVFGYGFMIALALTGRLDGTFVALFLLLALLYGTVVSVAALSIELFMRVHFRRPVDRVMLLLTALGENFGFRQWHAWVRFRATLKLGQKKGQWGTMTRTRIQTK